MKVAFRVDASIEIGTGHVIRCVTLADILRVHGYECLFICRSHPGNLIRFISTLGFKTLVLPEIANQKTQSNGVSSQENRLGVDWEADADDTCKVLSDLFLDWLIVDHYGLDQKWELSVRSCCRHLMVIDDLANRRHYCDLLLDQNLGRTAKDYSGLVPVATLTLIGPRYALLRPDFAQMRPTSLKRRHRPRLRHLLITMGGVDKDNATGQILDLLKCDVLSEFVEITVVLGSNSPWLDEIRSQAKQMHNPTNVLSGVSDMASLMTDCDLAIGAGGTTAWERCCLGLPSIIFAIAENQISSSIALERVGAALVVSRLEELKHIFRKDTIEMIQILHSLGKAAAHVTDGTGAKSVALAMISSHE